VIVVFSKEVGETNTVNLIVAPLTLIYADTPPPPPTLPPTPPMAAASKTRACIFANSIAVVVVIIVVSFWPIASNSWLPSHNKSGKNKKKKYYKNANAYENIN